MSKLKVLLLSLGFISFAACTTNNCKDGVCAAAAVATNSLVTCTNPPANYSGLFWQGNGSTTSPYVICTSAQLNGIATDPNYLAANYILAVDLDLSSFDGSSAVKTFNPIGAWDYNAKTGSPFTGSFKGQSHTISNLKVDNTAGTNSAGLFAFTKGANVSDLTLNQIDVRANAQAGGLIGYAEASAISNVSVQGNLNVGANITGSWVNRIGGLVGFADDNGPSSTTQITNCHTNVTVFGNDQVAGLVGSIVHAKGSLILSGNTVSGQIVGPSNTNSGNTFGGLVAYINMTNSNVQISNSSTTATVSTQGSFSAAGLGTVIVLNSPLSIKGCHSGGDFTTTGAITLPNLWPHGSFNGGFMGILNVNNGTATIETSYSTGNVQNTGTNGGSQLGNFIGSLNLTSGQLQLNNDYATGNVTSVSGGALYGGSFIGYASVDAGSTLAVTNAYASGTVISPAGTTNIGSFVGGISGGAAVVFNSAYFNDAMMPGVGGGVPLPGGLVGESLPMLANQNTFVGWDFGNVWSISAGNSPVLK